MAETATVDPDLAGAVTPTGEPVTGPEPQIAWTEAIPSEYRTDKVWEPLKGKGLGDVLKGYAEAQKLVGASVRLPGKDAKPEELARWKAEHGPKLAAAGLMAAAPAKPEDYQIQRPEAAVDLGWDTEAETFMRGVWHKAGMSQEQVNAVLGAYVEWQGKKLKDAESFVTKSAEELKAEWGADYEPRLGRAVRFLKETGTEYGIPELMDATGLGNHANVVRWIAHLAQQSVEHGAFDGAPEPAPSDEEFTRRATELRVEMGKTNAGSARMATLQAELEALYQRRQRRT